jgi:hypothetical protein
MKDISRDIQHYIPLISIFLAGIVGFAAFSFDRVFQATLTLALATAYVFWGIVHHSIHKDLHLSVILEYIVVAALGVVIVFSLLFRA